MLSGDIHSSWVNDLSADPAGAASPVVATELVGPPVTSKFPFPGVLAATAARAPGVHYVDDTGHGYARVELDRSALRAEYRYVTTTDLPDAGVATGAGFAVEAGRPGAHVV